MRQHFRQPEGLPPVNGYSHAVVHTGRTVLVSGQVPLDPNGNLVGRGDPERQVAQVFSNLVVALGVAGAGMADVVKLTVYLTDLADLAVFRQVRDRHICLAEPPACTLVRVSGLINPEFRVEIDAIAALCDGPGRTPDGHAGAHDGLAGVPGEHDGAAGVHDGPARAATPPDRQARVAAEPGTWPSPLSALDAAAPHAPRTAYAGVAVSGDGGTVWWAESRPGDAGRVTVLRRTGDGPVREVLPADLDARTLVHEYGGLSWAVTGTRLVVSNFADQRLYRVDGGAHRALTPDAGPADRYGQPTPLPGGDWVLCIRERHGPRVTHALVAVPLDGSGAVVDLWTGSDFVVAPAVSPDGRRLAFLTWDHPAMPWDGSLLRVAALDLRHGPPTLGPASPVLGGPEEAVLAPTWADNDTLHAVTDRSGWWNLVRVPASGGAPEPLWPVDRDCGVPLWRLGQRTHLDVAGGRTAVLAGGRLHVVGSSGEASEFATPFTSWLPWLDSAADVLVGVAASEERRPAVVRVDLRTGGWTVVAGPGQPDPAWVSRPEPFEVLTVDGRSVPAHLYPPTSPTALLPAGTQPPAVLFAHGGPTASVPRYYQDDVHFLTSRGLAVVAVDYTGSSGHGRAYRTALRGQWGVVDVEDCAAVARALLDRGRVSGVAIRGMSAGGLTALAAVSRPDPPFAGAVSYYGVSDLEDQATRTHDFESRYHESLIGPFPAARELYRERSPLTNLAAVRRPVLLVHGLRDSVVPAAQSRAVAEGLAARNVPHALLTFPGEGHGFTGPPSIATALEAELGFYGQIFGFAPADDALHRPGQVTPA